VLRPAGLNVHLGWPAVVAATVLAWSQALIWWPFPLRFLRCVVIALVVTALGMVVPVFGLALQVPPTAWSAWAVGMAALIPVAYGVAVAGVARTRRGDVPEWTWPARLARAVADWLPRRRAAFTSPLQAQAWLEWSLRGWGFPFAVGMVLLVWLPIALTGAGERVIANLASAGEAPALARVADALTVPGLWLAQLLALPLLLAGMSGIEQGGTRFIGQRPMATALHPFVALRPLTDGELVLAKLRMATRATLTGWALVLVAVVLWLGLTGAGRVMAGAPILRPYSTLQIAAGLAAGFVGLVLFTWIGLVSSLWIGLTGRAWLQNAVGFAAALVWMPLGLAGYWLSQHPDALAGVISALPYVAGGAVVLKLLLVGWLARVLWRRGLVAPRALVLSAVAWVITAAITFTLLGWIVPADWVSRPALPLGVALLLPLNRFAGAPLALAWNRHR
jgi:hypothetical protein